MKVTFKLYMQQAQQANSTNNALDAFQLGPGSNIIHKVFDSHRLPILDKLPESGVTDLSSVSLPVIESNIDVGCVIRASNVLAEEDLLVGALTNLREKGEIGVHEFTVLLSGYGEQGIKRILYPVFEDKEFFDSLYHLYTYCSFLDPDPSVCYGMLIACGVQLIHSDIPYLLTNGGVADCDYIYKQYIKSNEYILEKFANAEDLVLPSIKSVYSGSTRQLHAAGDFDYMADFSASLNASNSAGSNPKYEILSQFRDKTAELDVDVFSMYIKSLKISQLENLHTISSGTDLFTYPNTFVLAASQNTRYLENVRSCSAFIQEAVSNRLEIVRAESLPGPETMEVVSNYDQVLSFTVWAFN